VAVVDGEQRRDTDDFADPDCVVCEPAPGTFSTSPPRNVSAFI
jgi:hypothetical protein